MGASVTYQTINPETHAVEEATTSVRSLLTRDGIRFMYAGVVQNFMNFTAVGVIIVAMLGVGVAEAAGLIKAHDSQAGDGRAACRLTYILVFIGIISSIAADAGYLVLIPLAAAAYLSVGRHPLAGLAASFAGRRRRLQRQHLRQAARWHAGRDHQRRHPAHESRPSSISLTSNLWFSIASVILLTVVVALISDKMIEPRLGPYTGEGREEDAGGGVSPEESRGLKYATWGLIGMLVFFVLLTLPPGAPLRNPETGSLIADSPFMNGLIVFIALVFLAAGSCLWHWRRHDEEQRGRHQGDGESRRGPRRPDLSAVRHQPVQRVLHLHEHGDDCRREDGRCARSCGARCLAVAPRVRLRRRGPRSDHDGRHPEVGHLRARSSCRC